MYDDILENLKQLNITDMEIDEGKRRSLKMDIKVLDKCKRDDKEEAEDKLNLEATEKEKRKKKLTERKPKRKRKK